jgi:hypothetical protein
MSHTPGPWSIAESGSMERSRWSVCGPGGKRIVTGRSEIRDTPEEVQGALDARLIAAAPELLEACRQLLKYEGDDPLGGDTSRLDLAIEMAAAAVAKATGKE